MRRLCGDRLATYCPTQNCLPSKRLFKFLRPFHLCADSLQSRERRHCYQNTERRSPQISLFATGCGFRARHQSLLLSPTQPLDGRLSLEGRRFRPLGLAVGQFHRKPAACISRSLAGSVGLQSLREVVRDARVERAVTTTKNVDEPAASDMTSRGHDNAVARSVALRRHELGFCPYPNLLKIR